MAITTGILPNDLGTPPGREPLQPLYPRATSPSLTITKRIRRKNSFIRQPDSSEDFPSPHDSIYEAVYISTTNSDSSGNRIELVDIPPRKTGATKSPAYNDENKKLANNTNLSSIDDTDFRYGWGTPLFTITEQRSYSTMRASSRAKSADDIPFVPFLGHRDSLSLAKSPRRKSSLSLDDISLVSKSYHDACSTIERELSKFSINEIYAEPKAPPQAPPDRPPTPEGLPSWTAAQNMPRPGRPGTPVPSQSVFSRLLNLPSSTLSLSSRAPAIWERNRSVSAPVGGRLAPRFRPPKSPYGPIDQHPFVNARVATPGRATPDTECSQYESVACFTTARRKKTNGKGKLQRVRFTPSATARDSEIISLQTAMESSSTLAIHPLAPMPPMEATPTITEFDTEPRGCPHRRARSETRQTDTVYGGQTVTNLEDSHANQTSTIHINTTPEIFYPESSTVRTSAPHYSESSDQPGASIPSLVIDPPRQQRATSFSSTHPLMSGGIHTPNHTPRGWHYTRSWRVPLVDPQTEFCWKCTLDKARTKVDEFWTASASCLCFVVCGVDIEEPGRVRQARPVTSVLGYGSTASRGSG